MKTSILAGLIVSMLLLTLPAAASEDCTLDIFGNANEDETINMQDVTYTELIILEYRDQTELSDAKYDGKINMQDVTQIELVILGKEQELTILDDPQWDDPTRVPVTIRMPVTSVVVGDRASAEALRILDSDDTIIGVDEDVIAHEQFGEIYFKKLTRLPSIGYRKFRDYEAVLNLKPDLFIGQADREKLPGIPVIMPRLGYPVKSPTTERIRLLGYIFDRHEEAEEYIDWYDDVIDTIQGEIESEFPERDDRPRVVYARMQENGLQIHVNSGGAQVLWTTLCRNAGGELPEPYTGGHPTVDSEWLLTLDPDVIIVGAAVEPYNCGYSTDDPSEIAATRERFMTSPIWDKTTAVAEGRMYVTAQRCLTYSPCTIVGVSYYVKWIYPDLFSDLDPVAIHQEYVNFQGIDFDVSEHGVFVYPPMEES